MYGKVEHSLPAYPRFTDGITQARRGKVTVSRSHSGRQSLGARLFTYTDPSPSLPHFTLIPAIVLGEFSIECSLSRRKTQGAVTPKEGSQRPWGIGNPMEMPRYLRRPGTQFSPGPSCPSGVSVSILGRRCAESPPQALPFSEHLYTLPGPTIHPQSPAGSSKPTLPRTRCQAALAPSLLISQNVLSSQDLSLESSPPLHPLLPHPTNGY